MKLVMKKTIYTVIILMLAMSSLRAASADSLKIIYMNTPQVEQGARCLHVGDVITDSKDIKWSNERQVIKVLDMTTKKQIVLKPEKLQVAVSHSSKDYMNLNYNLSTRDEISAAGYFFIQYRKDGHKKNMPIAHGSVLKGLPSRVSLYYSDPDTGVDALITDDFISFLNEFKKADNAVSVLIDREKHWDMYQKAMWVIMSRPHCEVDFTPEDASLYLSLKR